MDFEWSTDQEELRESVRQYVEDEAGIATMRAIAAGDARALDAHWNGLVELGIPALLVEEEHGGAGLGMLEMGVVLFELGRALSPSPVLASSCVGTRLLSTHAREELLDGGGERLANGTARVAVALDTVADAPVRASTALSGGHEISGRVRPVLNATGCDAWLVPTELDGDTALFLVDAKSAGAFATRVEAVDVTRRLFEIDLDRAPARLLASGATAEAALAEGRDLLAMGLAADAVGAAERALELALAHAGERVQFGRAIGSFQAVQHLLVDMLRDIELVRAATIHALWSADHAIARDRSESAAVAKAAASELLPGVGASAIQIFGGVGFTWEMDIHLFDKRLSSQALLGGRAARHLATLARLALDLP